MPSLRVFTLARDNFPCIKADSAIFAMITAVYMKGLHPPHFDRPHRTAKKRHIQHRHEDYSKTTGLGEKVALHFEVESHGFTRSKNRREDPENMANGIHARQVICESRRRRGLVAP